MAILSLQNEAPSVIVREFDQSTVVQPSGPTTTYLVGFTPQGPTDEPMYVNSIDEFETIFGVPTTAAERYAYDSAKQILTTSPGRLLFTRMPYGSGGGIGYSNTYSALVYPVIGMSATEVQPVDYFSELTYDEIAADFPWLLDQLVAPQYIGSPNMECVLEPTEETSASNYVIHNYPFPCDGTVTEFKWYGDSDETDEYFTIYSLKALTGEYDGQFVILESITISGDDVVSDGNIRTVSLVSNPLTVEKGGIFATTSRGLSGNVPVNGTVFSYFDVDKTGKCSVLSFAEGSGFFAPGGFELSREIDVTNNGDVDYLVQVKFEPASACGSLSVDQITGLNLQVPEKERYILGTTPGDTQLNNVNFYIFLEPTFVELTETEYELFKNGQFSWKCGTFANSIGTLNVSENDVRAGIVIVNEIKAAQLDDFSGYYITLNDNYNVNPSTDFDAVDGVKGKVVDAKGCFNVIGSWEQLDEAKLNFKTHAAYNGTSGSISEIIESNAGLDFGKDTYRDSLILSLFKLRPSPSKDVSKLEPFLVEKFIGSLNEERRIEDPDGGISRSMFLETAVNNASNYMKVYVNPYISQNNCWSDSNGEPVKVVRLFQERTSYLLEAEGVEGEFNADFTNAFNTANSTNIATTDASKFKAGKMYSNGSYSDICIDKLMGKCKKKDIGNLPQKIERSLRIVDNPLVFDFDITLDSGLSTIWATRQAVEATECGISTDICYHYDDTVFVDTNSLSPYDGNPISSAIQDGWENIYNIFDNYARFTRKANGGVGHLHIQDPLRQIFVNGKDFKVVDRQKKVTLDPATGQPTERFSTFSRNIWTYLKNLYQSVNSSYSVSYANWIKDYDQFSDKNVWLPISGRIAAMYNRIDADEYPWYSPFGINRGVLPNILDLAINPSTKEQGLIYRLSINPVVLFPEGYVVWGNKTLLKKNSALSQVNVRRGLIFLEKITQRALREFIGEPNTIVTRTRVVNKLTPIFETAKQNQGLYDYKIVVSASPTDIDNGCLKVAIYVSPVKGIQYILADFYITRTGVSMGELD